MVKRVVIACLCLLSLHATAQEVLLPLECTHSVRRGTKSTIEAVRLPFFDDFASGRLSPGLWQTTGGASASYDVSPLSPTVGVATLDALGYDGYLYGHASTNIFPADTLCSAPIRLDSLGIADSLLLSFYWLPGGGFGNLWERVGDTPDSQDSLYLDFFCPSDSLWHNVWRHSGISVDSLMAHTASAWQYVAVKLTDPCYFDSMFRFRFRNHASLESSPKAGRAANCDQWHLDYVQLDSGRSSTEVHHPHDVAFAATAPSMLKNYRAMPYRQYSAADMANQLDITITNLYNATLASHYSYQVLSQQDEVTASYDGGFENLPPHLPDGSYQTADAHAHPPVSFSFPEMDVPTEYTVVHTVREGTGGDAFPYNDTIRFRQIFDNYFAYDDGTAENGYGITSTASRLYLSCRFDLNQPDTITALDIFFNSTLDKQNEGIAFYITLWNETDGHPGETIYRDVVKRYPVSGSYHRYVLEHPVTVSGSVYAGFEQSGNDFINIGYDRSLNTADRLWYLTGTEWQQSILSGTLMLRPCLGANATVGIGQTAVETPAPRIFPNPASDQLHIEGVPSGSRIILYDFQGRRLNECLTTPHQSPSFTLDTHNLPCGIYLLHILTPQGASYSHKTIIHR